MCFKIFHSKFAEIFGKEHCTPNMHMTMHIKDCLLDFGPVYSFWCFSFERYNGILGKFSTNNHSISLQLMRKFVNSIRIQSSYASFEVSNLPSLIEMNVVSDEDDMNGSMICLDQIRRKERVRTDNVTAICHEVMSIGKLETLSFDDVIVLTQRVQFFMPDLNIANVSRFIHTYRRIRLGKEIISSIAFRSGTSADRFVNAFYITSSHEPQYSIRPGVVSKIFDITVTTINDDLEHDLQTCTFAIIHWFEEHPYKDYYGVNSRMKIWATGLEIENDTSYIPVNFIVGKCSATKAKAKFNQIPLNNRLSKAREVDVVHFII